MNATEKTTPPYVVVGGSRNQRFATKAEAVRACDIARSVGSTRTYVVDSKGQWVHGYRA